MNKYRVVSLLTLFVLVSPAVQAVDEQSIKGDELKDITPEEIKIIIPASELHKFKNMLQVSKTTCRVGVSTWSCPAGKECDYDNYGCKKTSSGGSDGSGGSGGSGGWLDKLCNMCNCCFRK